ncbi:MAG TPA: virulence RhuM family protein [Myxococcota bacterium]|nr:virulence RhuM family protein [Myxococcota bacterium]
MTDPTGELLLYTDDGGAVRVHVRLRDGTVWMTQRQLAALFSTSVQNVSQHLQGIFEEGELDERTIKQFLIVQIEGTRKVSRRVDHYSLPAIIALGYRVKSPVGTRFRQWATERLEEFVVKGFTMDDERLKSHEAADYFDELLERIRAIRASERRFYQKIADIYARCSVDYDRSAEITRTFYATVQNKLHFAIHGRTAAEVIHERVDHTQPNMGLTTWKAGPDGPIRKADVTVAKNYLSQDELRELERIVTMFLDYAEDQARRRRAMTMADWVERLDLFLRFNDREVLPDAGRVSAALAELRAAEAYDRFQATQRAIEANEPVSDFDRVVEATRRVETKDGGK